MKVDMYVDMWSGQDLNTLMAVTNPGQKIPGSKRYKISVNIPDKDIFGIIDSYIPLEKPVEVDAD